MKTPNRTVGDGIKKKKKKAWACINPFIILLEIALNVICEAFYTQREKGLLLGECNIMTLYAEVYCNVTQLLFGLLNKSTISSEIKYPFIESMRRALKLDVI